MKLGGVWEDWRINECSKMGAPADMKLYNKGLHHGITAYCNRDWQKLGNEHGLNGYNRVDFDVEQAICDRVDHQIDKTAYFTGLEHGARRMCPNIDWYQHGFNAGNVGESYGVSRDNPPVCKYFNIAPNQYDFRRGYSDGLKQFCTPGKIFELGSSGQAMLSVCNGVWGMDFKNIYHLGQQAAAAKTERAKIQAEYDRIDQLLYINQTLSAEERQHYMVMLEQKRWQIGLINRKIRQLKSYAGVL